MYKVKLNGEKSNPHLKVGMKYLIKYHGDWYLAKCGKQWYGHTFWLGSHSVQLDVSIEEVYLFTPPEELKPGWYCQHV